MSDLIDLGAILVAGQVGVVNASIFLAGGAEIPGGDGPYLVITTTGGSGPEDTHNAAATGTGVPAYQRPAAQIVVRAASYLVAETMAYAAYVALRAVRNRFVNGVHWRSIVCLQEPSGVLGPDAIGRQQSSFNIAYTKRPTAALSL